MKLEDDIRYELNHLPKSLPDLYAISVDQIIRLGRSSYAIAMASLQLLTVALRPIPWEEFLSLLSYWKYGPHHSISRAELLNITSNFLEDDETGDWPRFAHTSARDYLESRPEFQPKTAHMTAAVICLESLRYPSFMDEISPSTMTLAESVKTFQRSYGVLFLASHLAATDTAHRNSFTKIVEEFILTPSGHSLQQDYALFKIWRARVAKLSRVSNTLGEKFGSFIVPADTVLSMASK